MRNKERDKATRHFYYLAHKEDFRRRNREYWARHRDRLAKTARRRVVPADDGVSQCR
jgi:hypothetical protein